MTASLVSVGAIDRFTNGNLNPGNPPSYLAGDKLYIASVAFGTQSVSTAPSGYVDDTPGTPAQCRLWRTTALTNGADTIPTLKWGTGYAAAVAFAIRGLDSAFTQAYGGDQKATTSTGTMNSPSVTNTPVVPGTINFILAGRAKTTLTDGATYSNPSGWSSIIALASGAGGANVDVQTGNNNTCFALWIQIQTTATAIPPNTGAGISNGKAETSSQALQSIILGYIPQIITLGNNRTLLGVGS